MSSLGRPYVPLPTAVTYNVFSRTLNPTHFTEIGCSLGAWGGTRATVKFGIAPSFSVLNATFGATVRVIGRLDFEFVWHFMIVNCMIFC